MSGRRLEWTKVGPRAWMESTGTFYVRKWLPEPLEDEPAGMDEPGWVFSAYEILGDETICWVAACDTLAGAKAAAEALPGDLEGVAA